MTAARSADAGSFFGPDSVLSIGAGVSLLY